MPAVPGGAASPGRRRSGCRALPPLAAAGCGAVRKRCPRRSRPSAAPRGDVERRLADHALTGGVDQHAAPSNAAMALVPGHDGDRPPEVRREPLRMLGGAVDQAHFRASPLDQAEDDGAATAAGADHRRRRRLRAPCRARPPRCSAGSRTRRSWRPGNLPPAPTVTQLIAPMARAASSTVSTRPIAASLCGMVRLHPEKPSGAKRRSAAAKSFCLDGQRHIGAGEPVLRQPIVVQFGRARMHHRPAHHAGEVETFRLSHRLAVR